MKARILALACAAAAGIFAVAPASAQDLGSTLETRLREISFDDKGQTRLVVSVAGPGVGDLTLNEGNFKVKENGTEIPGLAVEQLFGSTGTKTVAVALVMDVSGSTVGAPLLSAKQEAKNFVNALPAGVRIALVSFGRQVLIPVDFTTDKALVTTGIDALEAGGRTRLFDAVVLGANRLTRQLEAQRNMVIFSDGNDTVSEASLGEARSALRTADVPALAVLLSTTRKTGEEELQSIARAERGGQYILAANSEQLATAFARIAQTISSQYVLTYKRDDVKSRDLNIEVSAQAGGFVASDQSVVLNGRQRAAPPPLELVDDKPLIPALANRLGYAIAIVAAFLSVLLFVGMLFWSPAGKTGEKELARRLRLYGRGAGAREKRAKSEAGAFFTTTLGQRATSLVEKAPRWGKIEESLQKEIAQAGWPLRSSEFVLIQIGAAVAGLVIGAVLFGRFWLGAILLFFGAIVPRLLLVGKIAKRSSAFLEQLPETLQLLSGSLQAGYGFVQALDTVAKESPEPTASEFTRVLTEARLGMPLEDALDEMAERVGGEDFKWVVLAINIQRQVGGNLAQLLTTVANTLRERERVRRQIKVLSAEGRLSAIILTALPFVLFGYLSLINPGYIGQLTQATIGKIMMVGSLVLIAIGALWMRKMIKIDV